jgi:hypothetical protein
LNAWAKDERNEAETVSGDGAVQRMTSVQKVDLKKLGRKHCQSVVVHGMGRSISNHVQNIFCQKKKADENQVYSFQQNIQMRERIRRLMIYPTRQNFDRLQAIKHPSVFLPDWKLIPKQPKTQSIYI